MNILIALLILGIIVIVHELGHFITAKMFKMPVQEFSIGMGPYIYKYQGDKTTYTVRSIPIGGYVAIEGMELDSKSVDGFNTKPILQRMIVLSAGVIMNFFLAFILIFGMLMVEGKSTLNEMAIIGEVSTQSRAQEFIKAQDKILVIDTTVISGWNGISEYFSNYSKVDTGDKEVDLKLMRDGEVINIRVPLTYDPQGKRYLLGIIPERISERYTLKSGLIASKNVFFNIFKDILNGFKQLIKGEIKQEDLTGPLGIINVVGEASKEGARVLIWLTILLSVNIGIFNLLPFPALDGGRLIFLFLEMIGIKVNKKTEEKIHLAGMAILLILIIYITGNDIFKMTGR